VNVPEELVKQWFEESLKNARVGSAEVFASKAAEFGAERMREQCAQTCKRLAQSFSGHSDHSRGMERGAMDCADVILALPLAGESK